MIEKMVLDVGTDEVPGEVAEDLAVFRWLEKHVKNKKAITACLLVLQGTSCNEAPLGANLVVMK